MAAMAPPQRAKNREQRMDCGAEAGPDIRPEWAPDCAPRTQKDAEVMYALPQQHGTEGARKRFRENCQPARPTHDCRRAGGPE